MLRSSLFDVLNSVSYFIAIEVVLYGTDVSVVCHLDATSYSKYLYPDCHSIFDGLVPKDERDVKIICSSISLTYKK